jgi:drug/metabolite transporter (DMT)-like permease
MRKIRLGTNFTIFLLFFGVAALEALQTRNWIKAGFWLAIGCAFLYVDSSSYQRRRNT